MNLLFDLDGTLTNPERGITGCILYALERLDCKPLPSRKSLTRCIGPPLYESFAELLETSDPKRIERGIELYRERFNEIGIFENEVYADIPKGLADLAKAGHRLWVATSKPRVYARRIVAHFELSDYFQLVYGSELSGQNTNKVELIAHLLKSEKLDPAQTCMIGDRAHDILGGLANGLQTIGVRWGFGSEAELRAAQAHLVVDSMSALTAAVQ